MNKDFHYYGTYVAGCLAGYNFSSAELITHAAQQVDDSDVSRLKDSNGSYYIKIHISAYDSRTNGIGQTHHEQRMDESFPR